jgi:CO/xanthine dehydrogenase Mo-binding subunit
MGGSIANAIFDATGARIFELPMAAERVKKALSGK